jgi:hypothetical protein
MTGDGFQSEMAAEFAGKSALAIFYPKKKQK